MGSVNLGELTNSLVNELDKTTGMFDRWVERQEDKLASNTQTYFEAMDEHARTLETLSLNEEQLEEARVQNDEVKKMQEDELNAVAAEVEAIKRSSSHLPQELSTVERSHRETLDTLDEIRQEFDKLSHELEQRRLDQLYGLDKYRALGLIFQKSAQDQLAFVFTQVDPRDPMRAFQFDLIIDEDDKYAVAGCVPRLPAERVLTLVTQVNSDCNLGRFVLSMRKEFKRLCHTM